MASYSNRGGVAPFGVRQFTNPGAAGFNELVDREPCLSIRLFIPQSFRGSHTGNEQIRFPQ